MLSCCISRVRLAWPLYMPFNGVHAASRDHSSNTIYIQYMCVAAAEKIASVAAVHNSHCLIKLLCSHPSLTMQLRYSLYEFRPIACALRIKYTLFRMHVYFVLLYLAKQLRPYSCYVDVLNTLRYATHGPLGHCRYIGRPLRPDIYFS